MALYSDPLPEPPDYYVDLGITINASRSEVRKAFTRLARILHPDKMAPGQTIDAEEFRKIREAYEVLIDDAERTKYDKRRAIHGTWKQARDQEQEEGLAKERARALAERAERERQAAEAERARRKQEEEQAARDAEERTRRREEKIRLAEERSREAARKAREEQEKVAKERIRKQKEEERRLKEEEAERRSREAARRDQLERQRMAAARLKACLVEEKQDALRQNWAKMREAAETRASSGTKVQGPGGSVSQGTGRCMHPKFGWPKKKGKVNCAFCGVTRTKWSYRCPVCNAAAYPACKND